MPASVAIPLIIGAGSAGAQIYGANKAASTAKSAAKTQAESGQQALARYDQLYAEQKTRQQPYMAVGSNALQQLGQMGANPVPQFNPSMGMGGWNQQPPQQSKPQMMGQPPMGQPQPPQGDMVQMRAPDGSVRPVPRAMVPQFQAKGATVIN